MNIIDTILSSETRSGEQTTTAYVNQSAPVRVSSQVNTWYTPLKLVNCSLRMNIKSFLTSQASIKGNQVRQIV